MNVSVTPELEAFVRGLVESGRYHSASEVFREGLRLLERAEHRRLLEKWLVEGLTPEEEARVPADMLEKFKSHIRAKVNEGLASLDRGELIDGPEFMAKMKAKLEAALEAEKDAAIEQRT